MNLIEEVLESERDQQVWLTEKLRKSFNMMNSYLQKRIQSSLEVLFKNAEFL